MTSNIRLKTQQIFLNEKFAIDIICAPEISKNLVKIA